MTELATRSFCTGDLQDYYGITSGFSIRVEGPAKKIDGITRQMLARIVFGSGIQQYVREIVGKTSKEIEEYVQSVEDPFRPPVLHLEEEMLRNFLREKIGLITDQIEEIEGSGQKLLQVAQAVFLLSNQDIHLYHRGLKEIASFLQEGRDWLQANPDLKWSVRPV